MITNVFSKYENGAVVTDSTTGISGTIVGSCIKINNPKNPIFAIQPKAAKGETTPPKVVWVFQSEIKGCEKREILCRPIARTDVQLGKKYTDTVTGISGVAVDIAKWQYGCIRVTLQPKAKRGETVEPERLCVDEEQLKGVKPVVNFTGGPTLAPPKV